jgi:PST family polysaccharide transporter
MLFWINLAVGALLTAVCAAVAPLVAAFYREPRLLWVTVVVGTGFLFNGATAQHRAVLQRNMRFGILAVVDISALLLSILLGLGMAVAGQGYWALVGMAVALPVASFVGLWLAGGWLPALPRRGAGVGSMLKYGGTVTLNNVVVYLAYNADKVLLGRFWGSVPLGLYGRAYQLINLPNDTLASSVGLVAFPALARLQNDPARLRSYFLNGYGLFLSLIIPITTACALFAEDIIRVFLGQKWGEAAPVFRLLVPTILAFALINPFSWLLQATGRVVRSLNIAFLIAPLVILGYVAGLSHGPTGVAAGFSTTIMLLVVPVIFWATRGTPVTALDALKVVMRPFLAALIGAGVTLGAWGFIGALTTPLLRLVVANAALFGVYALVLCFGMGQWSLSLRLFRELGLWPFARRSTRDASMQPQNA